MKVRASATYPVIRISGRPRSAKTRPTLEHILPLLVSEKLSTLFHLVAALRAEATFTAYSVLLIDTTILRTQSNNS